MYYGLGIGELRPPKQMAHDEPWLASLHQVMSPQHADAAALAAFMKFFMERARKIVTDIERFASRSRQQTNSYFI